ncbi:hypothetical protein QFZ30_003331 [Arthrobacter pascens]|uniref:hypothetical protein n=1 Tax=Arthrobacter pascens TaxID=1677 RepID=UPI00278F98D5|nr:hypothetical protein [Arthrobacter pascens]
MSNIGTLMQRTARDWLVFDHLRDHDAGAMGLSRRGDTANGAARDGNPDDAVER